ncbi:ATP-grasp domain-containing protein [Saccharothrix sp. AJ9571]|nr:ATP-grasp domain-containing protein [Saccharothrix sp. AJ9571]
MAERPTLLVLVGGQREYREYMLMRLSARYRLTLLSPWPVTWEKRYIADHALIEPDEPERIFAAASRIAERHSVSGVLTYYEPCVVLASEVAQRLGLPQCPPEAARRCRDKYATRAALAEAGVPSARFAHITSTEQGLKAAAEIGYPVVVKPRSLSASFGVSLAADPGELDLAIGRAQANHLTEPWEHQAGIMVEKYLDGPEISVDSVVTGGVVTPLVYAKKLSGFPPAFEELGHVVAAPELIVSDPDAVRELLVQAHAALGIDNAVTHTEVRLTSSGPRIVEVNGRSGGDLIPQLAELATGVDIALASGDVAAGRTPELAATHSGVAGVRFFYPGGPGTVVSVGWRAGFGEPEWLRDTAWLLEPGAEVHAQPGRLYLDRFGYGVATARSVEDCVSRLETLAREARVELA